MKRIMVIAGGDWQVELVKKAKKLGHYVICSNLYKDSPAFSYADAWEIANVLDKEKNLNIAQKYMPDAVISDQSDIAVPTVAYINEKLGLHGIGMDKAALFTDKSLLREYCHHTGITIPDYKTCSNLKEAKEMLNRFGKIIIKPIDSQSSRGVFTIHSEKELYQHYEETLSYSNKKKVILAEEYIDGAEFTVDGLVVNGKHYPLCISIKEMYKDNPNISKQQTYTHYHSLYDYTKLREINRSLIEQIGLPFGLTHSEYKFYDGQYYLIEAGARGGGSNLSASIVPFMTGIDNYEYLIKEAIGENVDEEPLKKMDLSKERCVIMRFFDFGEGVVKKVHGSEELDSYPNLIDYQLEVKPGDILKNPRYGRLRPGHFIIGGDNYTQLEAEKDDILKKVYITFKK